jgi:MoaA/NifB/PqqE/SkfB family radical SAM enzyme
MNPLVNTVDFSERPFIAIWEVTQACDLACVHCRASAQPDRHPMELTTAEGKILINQIAEMQVPVFVLTGGDPIKRPDLFELIAHARSVGVRVSLTPSATPLLTREIVVRLKEAGLARLAVSMDGASAETHDAFRGMHGSFARTMDAVRWANEIGLPVQINTRFSRRNIGEIDAIVALMKRLKITLWSVFFLVPTGRGKLGDLLNAAEFEQVLEKIYQLSRTSCFDIKTTEAQHYRRYVLQQHAAERRRGASSETPEKMTDAIGRAPRGLNTAKASCSSRTPARFFQVAFCRSPQATSGASHSRPSIVSRRSFKVFVIPPGSRASAASASSSRFVVAHAPAPTRCRETHMEKSLAAPIFPGDTLCRLLV